MGGGTATVGYMLPGGPQSELIYFRLNFCHHRL